MKKIILSFIYILLFTFLAQAQSAAESTAKQDNRTLQTRVADILSQFPATDGAQLNKNMEEIASTGDNGILEMAKMLTPPGKGDNTKLQYALGGFTYYVTQANKEDVRLMASAAYTKALDQITDPDTKAFIISQLQLVGKDEAITSLAKYLSDERLCDPAARALIKINSATAHTSLLNALSGATGACQLSLLEALGDSRTKEAVSAISQLASNTDKIINKVALYALANIGDPSSEALLASHAEKIGYTFDETNATSSYLLWAKRMAEAGNTGPVEKMAQALLKKCTQDNQIHTRTAALKLLADINGTKSMPLLLTAATDKNKEYRVAALTYAASLKDNGANPQWLKALKKASPEVKADIISMLGNTGDASLLPAMTQALKSKEKEVRMAAIEASGKLGQESALPNILEVMKSADTTELKVAKLAILSMKGTNLASSVSSALPQMPSHAKAALLEVLGTRKANDKINEVLALASNQDKVVKLAAFNALQHVATQDNLPALFPLLLTSATPEETNAMQQAVINAVGGISDKAGQASAVLQQMDKAPAEKKPLFYAILASIGTSGALQAVKEEFSKGSNDTKKAAVEALSNWSNFTAASELFSIASSADNASYSEQALKGYVRQISISKYPPAQKFLLLRKAMDIAKSAEQKQEILQQIAQNKTFTALLFAGKFLDDPSVQQEAASAVMSIALANKEFYGNDVRALLNKTMQVLKGSESEYQKESIRKHLSEMPADEGFVPLFNGKDLSGWKGLVADPIKRSKMDEKTLAREQAKADDAMRKAWTVENGQLVFNGTGENLCTVKKYGDFEMYVDWKISKNGDAGVYLRGTPQVQIWDTTLTEVGAQVGSGGLYNNEKNPSKPLKVADNATDEWNTFHILMKGDRVTVHLNGEMVVNNVILENYWDRKLPIFSEEQIELQAHGTNVAYRDIYIREIPRPQPFALSAEEKKEGFKVLFDGTNMHNWTGNTQDYIVEDGVMVIYPDKGGKGNLYTKEEFSDFNFRFEFQLTPGANNGLGIRTPLEGDAAYVGMELQILDNEADIYKTLKPHQYHGSIYGIIAAKRGYLKPMGEWNYEEVIVKGNKVKVILNDTVILDGDITDAIKNGTLDGQEHPGLKRKSGHIGFLGHGSIVKFRNMRIKDLSKK